MMKYIFLDTNIFLHFQYYDEIAWENVIGNTQYTIVVAAIVIDELDTKKNTSSKKTAKRAKTILSKFDKIIDGEVKNSNIKLLSERPDEHIFIENNLSKSHQDNHLLASILNFKIEPGDEKILITNDTGARLRAKNLNIQCLKMPENYMLAEELDESETKIRNLQTENEKLKNNFPKVSLSFKDSKNLLVHTVIELEKAEFMRKETQINRRDYPFYKKKADLSKFEQIALSPLTRVSDESVEAYNIKLQRYYNQYDEYLEELYKHNIYLTSCLEIELILNNVGTSPAEDIDIHLHFPDGFELTKKLEKGPALPDPPFKPKSFWDMSPYVGFVGHSEHFPIINNNYQIHNINDNKPRLTKIEKTNSYDVEFKLKRLKHNLSIPLPKLFACFSLPIDMMSFCIDYTLIIGNVPEKGIGKLHINIKK